MTLNKAYIIGNGLAGLASAFYLVTESNIDPEKITIYENSAFDGGSLDAFDLSHNSYYFMRGFRMLESNVYSAFFDFISKVPFDDDSNKTLLDDFKEFNEEVKTFSVSRLIEKGKAINARQFKLKFADRVRILILLAKTEKEIENMKISEFFSQSFFNSNFWIEFATTFSFQPWHSLEEFKRYILRFIQCSPVLDSQSCIRSTRYNQYHSVTKPVKDLLLKKGVKFVYNAALINAKFKKADDKLALKTLQLQINQEPNEIDVSDNDLVFMTLGSMTSMFSVGSMKSPPTTPALDSTDWNFWKNIAPLSPEFGNPHLFLADCDATKWVSFTITFTNPVFTDLLEKITRTKAGREGPITIKDSPWLISFALPNHPHFPGQPENNHLVWGYGMHSNAKGSFVNKTLPECTGEEILYEIIRHLKFDDRLDEIIQGATCVPCMLPLITSQFMPRKKSDRPKVVPDCAKNFAFIGQYCEIDHDIVFTLEYSVRSAQQAVFTHLRMPEKVTPIYKGWRRLSHLFGAFRTVFR